MTRPIAITSVLSTSCNEARIVVLRSIATLRSMSLASEALSCGSSAVDPVDRVDDVGAGLPVEDHQHRRLAVGEPGVAQVFRALDDIGDIGEPHRRAVAIGDDQRPVILGLDGLVVGVELEAAVALVDRAFRAVRVGRGKRGAHVFEADAVFEQRQRVELDPHRRRRGAADRHLADALDLRQRGLQDGRGGVVHLALGLGVGGQRQDQDRGVGRVDLAVGRVGSQAGRQIGARRVDRRLHVARRAVDVAAQAELQGDAGRADGARRGHLGDVGDHPEMALERRRHGGRHRSRGWRPASVR